jgi:alpha-glucosidase
MFAEILRFWLDRGIGGFRVDVAHGLLKDPDLADAPGAPLLLALPGSAYIDQGE